MAKAARKGDIGSAHGCFPPSVAIEGSDDVFINGKPAVRVGDAYAAHGCGVCAPHGRKAVQGSATVNINGKPAVRVGDALDCGGNAETGSGNVFIGDTSWAGDAPMPDVPKMRLYLTNAAGSLERPYPNEPYKLYKDGALVQEGNTEEDGSIIYEYELPWTSELKIETIFGEYTFTPEATQPAESEAGVKQRLGILGYRDEYHGQKPIKQETGGQSDLAFLGDMEEKSNEDEKAVIPDVIKTILP